MVNGGEISVPTFGHGDGGTLTVTANTINVDSQNSQFFTGFSAQNQFVDSVGKGGDISINAIDFNVGKWRRN